MRVAREFGLDPRLVGREWTNRELRTAEAWIDEQMNVPSRTDHYLMQIACEVCLVLASKETRAKVSSNDFRLKFSRDDDKAKGAAAQDEYTRQLMIGMVAGKGFETRTITRTEAREQAKEIQIGARK